MTLGCTPNRCDLVSDNIVIDSKLKLIGDRNSKDLTIDTDEYIGNIKKYNETNYNKSTHVSNIESYSKDFKETYLRLPPTILLSDLDLTYDRKYSTWNSKEGEPIIYCDNNAKGYYKSPITGAIYIRTDFLKKVIQKHKVMYWAYTEKNYLDNGWNEDASLHIELDSNGNINSMFRNNDLCDTKKVISNRCKKCKFGIYQELNKHSINYSKLIDLVIKNNILENSENDKADKYN